MCAAMVLAMAFGVALTGCSSKQIWRASRQMCVAHGGTYSPEARQCQFKAGTTVSAKQACEDQGGLYADEWQRCQFDE
jgi:putative hemolysin